MNLNMHGYLKMKRLPVGLAMLPTGPYGSPIGQEFDAWLASEGLLDQLVVEMDFGEGHAVIARYQRDEDGNIECAGNPRSAVRHIETVRLRTPPPSFVAQFCDLELK